MARIPDKPTTWAEAYRKVHLEDAVRKKEQRARTKKHAKIVTINGMNYWKLPNGKTIGSWLGTSPNGAVSLGKGWWLDMRTGQIYRAKSPVGLKTFTYSEVDDYFKNTWNRIGNIDTALRAVEKKYGWLQRDRLERIHLHIDEGEE